MDPYDYVTHQDLIYKFYFQKEFWMKSQVARKKTNTPLVLGLFDVLPTQQLYNDNLAVKIVEYRLPQNTSISNLIQLPNSVYGIYYIDKIHNRWHRNISKSFNCFINRNDMFRQHWFYLLFTNNLLDDGYISFNSVSRSEQSNLQKFDDIHREYLSEFQPIFNAVRQAVPFKNFNECSDLRNVIMETGFSIILETYADRDDAIAFSEKIFRALQTPRPWVLFHARGAVEELRKMGFYVYDDLVDHSYDSMKIGPLDRQIKILDQVKKLKEIKITDNLLRHWERQTEKNCAILEDMNQRWKKDFSSCLALATEIANKI